MAATSCGWRGRWPPPAARPNTARPSVGRTMPPFTPPATCWAPPALLCPAPTAPTNTYTAGSTNCGLGPVVAAGRVLHSLRSRRNQADYDVGPSFPPHLAAGAIADAADILLAFDALSPADRTQVTDAIKLYEQRIGDVTWTP